jgi:hypothetical protein
VGHALMSEEGVKRDIKLRRVNVAEVPIADVRLGATHKQCIFASAGGISRIAWGRKARGPFLIPD